MNTQPTDFGNPNCFIGEERDLVRSLLEMLVIADQMYDRWTELYIKGDVPDIFGDDGWLEPEDAGNWDRADYVLKKFLKDKGLEALLPK